MKEFIKNNPTLAFGLGLPLLLVVVFSIAAGLPNLTMVQPKYDAVFATGYYQGNDGFRVNVVNGHVVASATGECGYCQVPEIYRYNAAAGTLKRITVDVPPEAMVKPDYQHPHGDTPKKILPVTIPELADVKLDDSNPAPDGYEFSYNDNYSSGGLLPELFFARSTYNNEPVLRKGTYRIRMPLPKNYYNSSNVRFLGWVVAQ